MAFCILNGVRFYYTMQGSGEHLLLLHGLGSCGEDWAQQAAELSKRFCVISMDLRGHGRSEKILDDYSIPAMARDVEALLHDFKIQKAHVVGFSMGGMVAFQFGVDYPLRLLSLTVINALPAMAADNWSSRIQIGLRLLVIRALGMKNLGKMIGRKLFPDPEQETLYQEFVVQMAGNHSYAYEQVLKAFLGWSVIERLKYLTMPTLIITASDDYTPVEQKQACVDLIPRGKLAVIPNSRHATPIDQPKELNRVLLEFLEAVSRKNKDRNNGIKQESVY